MHGGDVVSVLLGFGDGTFAARVRYPAGIDSISIAVVDLNDDQVLDLAVANEDSEEVSVLLGVGDGTFAPQMRYYAAGVGPSSIAIGDLNGDAARDLAVAHAGGGVSVLLQRGGGGSSPLGACCLEDGSCVRIDANSCGMEAGLFRGGGSLCPPDPECAPFDAIMTCELSSSTAVPGGTVLLELFVEEAFNLAVFQATILVTKMSGEGTVAVSCPNGARVNENICISSGTLLPTGDTCDGFDTCPVDDPPNVCIGRADYVFAHLSTIVGTNCGAQEIAAAILTGSVDVTGERKYIGEFELEVSPDAELGSTFEIAFVKNTSASFLNSETLERIPTRYGAPCVLIISDSSTYHKNRYLSFKPDEPGDVAYQLDMVSSLFHATAIVSGWVGVPDANGIASLEPNPVTRVWTEPVVYVTGCEITPVAEFELRASTDEGATFSPPAALQTTPQPGDGKFWGDIVGPFNGIAWPAPNGVTNIDDAFAVIQTWKGKDGAPELPRSDVEPQQINRVINFNDVLFVIFAFQGDTYPFGCPDDPCQDNIANPCP